MKKNNMLRIASVLLVAVLLSTCAISGAFAKYTTSGTAEDHARVAKFGITVSTSDDNLFASTYDVKTTGQKDADGDDITLSVSASQDVIAPGTNGTLTAPVSLVDDGREVAVTVTKTIDFKLKASDSDDYAWVDDEDEFYFPLIIKVGGETVDLTACDNCPDVEAAVEAKIGTASVVNYAVGQDCDSVIPSISWEWAFDTKDDEKNKADTALGRAGNAYIGVDISITVDQID